MFFRNAIFFIAVFLYFTNARALLLNHANASADNDDTGRLHRHHISSGTKQATKIAACATVGKGICLGVGGVKYIKKEINGTTVTEAIE